MKHYYFKVDNQNLVVLAKNAVEANTKAYQKACMLLGETNFNIEFDHHDCSDPYCCPKPTKEEIKLDLAQLF